VAAFALTSSDSQLAGDIPSVIGISTKCELRGNIDMPNKNKVAAAAFCAVLFAVSAANAARVSPQSGAVLVSKGEGFAPVTADMELAPGARVLVQPGGTAKIVYAGNCTIRVGQGFWLVQQTAPCVDGATEIDFTGRMNQAGPGDTLGPNDLIIGGIVVSGAIGVGLMISQAASSPSSP
jgi:hypothetical protein